MSPLHKLNKRIDATNSLLCVGLDADISQLPERFQKMDQPQFEFNKWIIEQTHQYVCSYKPNIAFYEARGDQGIRELKLTIEYLQINHPDIFTICDAKRADIGSTNQGYVTSIFDWFGFDAVTVNPYLGREAIQPFLDRKDKVSIILCRTSNPGSGELQDLLVGHPDKATSDGRIPLQTESASGEILRSTESRAQDDKLVPLWHVVAQKVSQEWNQHDNCMVVVGATYPEEMQKIREITGEMTFLVPGIGVQGGDVESTVSAGMNKAKKGMIINSARGIIFAKYPKDEAQKLQNQINLFRKV